MQGLLFGNNAFTDIRIQAFASSGFTSSSVHDAEAIGRRLWSSLISYICIVPDVSTALMTTEILSNIRDYAPSEYLLPFNNITDESRAFSASTILLMMEHLRFPMNTSLLSALRAALLGYTVRCKSDDALLANETLDTLLECR